MTMNKKSRNKKWRHVYPYICKGCGKRRIAFDHERAKREICQNCERTYDLMKDQPRLFDTPSQ